MNKAKGIFIGGGLNDHAIFSHLYDCERPDDPVIILTTASETRHMFLHGEYSPAITALNCHADNFVHVPIRDAADAHMPGYAALAARAQSVFISGGDQRRLACLRDTPFLQVVQERFNDDETFTLCGTSAGVHLTEQIITGSRTNERDVYIDEGLGLITERFGFDTHYDRASCSDDAGNIVERTRYKRIEELAYKMARPVIALPEDGGVILQNGVMNVVGNKPVIVKDASCVTATNLHMAKRDEAVFYEGMQSFYLNSGDIYKPLQQNDAYEGVAKRVVLQGKKP